MKEDVKVVSKIPYEERNSSNDWSHNVVLVRTGQYDFNDEMEKKAQEHNSNRKYAGENEGTWPFYEVT